mmetsp:Transcript_18748/g.61308  ORF Transcript_18748/g.61308 Transcript_18748/m.61308 type:complete len:363 (+) Transcript_18748:3611-4699(+)
MACSADAPATGGGILLCGTTTACGVSSGRRPAAKGVCEIGPAAADPSEAAVDFRSGPTEPDKVRELIPSGGRVGQREVASCAKSGFAANMAPTWALLATAVSLELATAVLAVRSASSARAVASFTSSLIAAIFSSTSSALRRWAAAASRAASSSVKASSSATRECDSAAASRMAAWALISCASSAAACFCDSFRADRSSCFSASASSASAITAATICSSLRRSASLCRSASAARSAASVSCFCSPATDSATRASNAAANSRSIDARCRARFVCNATLLAIASRSRSCADRASASALACPAAATRTASAIRSALDASTPTWSDSNRQASKKPGRTAAAAAASPLAGTVTRLVEGARSAPFSAA